MARNSICANCRFNIRRTCRRNAPKPSFGTYMDYRVVPWPEVSDDWWCGEWEGADSILDAWREKKAQSDAIMAEIVKDLEADTIDHDNWEPFEKPSNYGG
jgi:hypothetical protein